MKRKNAGLFEKSGISRRDFIKYAGSTAGLYLAKQWLFIPTLGLAADKPRVVSVRDSNATNWDYATGHHWQYINQTVVNDMVATGILALTNALSVPAAWNAVIPYQPGEAVAIKVNLNNSYLCGGGDDNQMDAYSETVNAVIDGLLSIGVPPDKIWITDPSRDMPTRFIDRITNPNVQYYSVGICSDNSHYAPYVSADSQHATPTTHPTDDVVRPAQVFVDAAHLINIPLLKGHGNGWMTLGMKNHYGSVIFQNRSRNDMHEYIDPWVNPDLEKSALADINNNPHIRNKTRLIIGDGLFGHPISNGASPQKWQIFNNDDPNILFFGTDPVATDSVMYDYIAEEHPYAVTHSSLHHGAAMGLGVHDHWDGIETKQYSSIDYINIDFDNPNRLDIDSKIRHLKEGSATAEEIKQMIDKYMNGP
jgi:uncharacterized protein (DUF362 family)